MRYQGSFNGAPWVSCKAAVPASTTLNIDRACGSIRSSGIPGPGGLGLEQAAVRPMPRLPCVSWDPRALWLGDNQQRVDAPTFISMRSSSALDSTLARAGRPGLVVPKTTLRRDGGEPGELGTDGRVEGKGWTGLSWSDLPSKIGPRPATNKARSPSCADSLDGQPRCSCLESGAYLPAGSESMRPGRSVCLQRVTAQREPADSA